jgi:hypothetical protein
LDRFQALSKGGEKMEQSSLICFHVRQLQLFFGEMNFLKDFLQLGQRLSFMNMNRLLVKLIFKANFSVRDTSEEKQRRAEWSGRV